MRAYKNNNKYCPTVGLSRQKIYAEQSQQQYFLFVGTDIDSVVTNQTLCLDGALIYGALQMKSLVYIQYGKYLFSFCPPWMGRPEYFNQNNQ